MKKIKHLIIPLLLTIIISEGCKKETIDIKPLKNNENYSALSVGCPDSTPACATLNFNPGQVVENNIVVDGSARTFRVYVPSNYDSTYNYPLVIMFHGSGQSGQTMVNNTSWNTQAELDSFIVLYPDAMVYNLAGNMVSKWNTANVALQLGIAQSDMADDLGFVAHMIRTTYGTVNINCRKIYASGFSNGGSFIKTELRVHMDRAFTAFSTAGGPGISSVVASDHGRNIPIYEVTGTNEQNIISNCGLASPLPLTEAGILGLACISDRINNLRLSLEMDPAYNYVANPPLYSQFTFLNSTVGQPTVYRFRMINGMDHRYPSILWTTDYVPIFWQFFDHF